MGTLVGAGVGVFILFILTIVFSIVSVILYKNKKRIPPPFPKKSKSKLDTKIVNEEKGAVFEEYIVKKFNPKYFTWKDSRSDKYYNGLYPESNTYPDHEFEFNLNEHSVKFAIECKFKKDSFRNLIELDKPEKFENYRNFQKEKNMAVYIALGLGGEPKNPDELYLIPLNDLKGNTIYYTFLSLYTKKKELSFYYNPFLKKFT